ncbi:MAG: hypothetical protein ACI9S9_002033 [Planctomycetota bacterium]|jgi:hypothetical protein
MRESLASVGVVRDLTNATQNAEVLTLATELLSDPTVDVMALDARCADPVFVAGNGPIYLEALRAAVGRTKLQQCLGALHLSVVWAMYNETARILPKADSEHGEDLVRAKVAQMRWLFEGTADNQTWELLACDDGCPESPSSSEVMQSIIDADGLGDCARVIKLVDAIAGKADVGAGFARLRTPADSRKGGSIAYGMWFATKQPLGAAVGAEHVVLYTDADLSSNLAQAGSLVHAIVAEGYDSAIGQRYGLSGSILVKEEGAITEPRSTGAKPSRNILLLRHFARVVLLPRLATVLDTQAGFKAFKKDVLDQVLTDMNAFSETFDVELMLRNALRGSEQPCALVPMLFTEDFVLTNFPSVDPGQQHLDMIQQIVGIHDACVGDVEPALGEAADLLAFFRELDLPRYQRLLDNLEALDKTGIDDPNLFDRRWTIGELRRYADHAVTN